MNTSRPALKSRHERWTRAPLGTEPSHRQHLHRSFTAEKTRPGTDKGSSEEGPSFVNSTSDVLSLFTNTSVKTRVPSVNGTVLPPLSGAPSMSDADGV